MVAAHRLTIETRGSAAVLICSHCQRPFLDIENGELRIRTKHGSKEHENFLTVEHLRMIAVEMFRQTHPPKEFW